MSQEPTNSSFKPPAIEEVSDLLPGYEIISFIAQGGMGAVYHARQISLDRDVAIKVLPRHFGADEGFKIAFEKEAKSMAKFNHPNVIGIYDFGKVDGMLYIIMELVKGKSLYHFAYGKTITPEDSRRIISEICQGLASAHNHGVLHRDIKPANILLDDDLSPKIGDFGLARPVGDHESDSAFGTPGYTAPEIVQNPKAIDESTDLYALGVMLYELLTGKLPESIYTPAATLVGCDMAYDQIIRKAIHPTPAMRFRKAEEFLDALKKVPQPKAGPVILTSAKSGTSSSAKPNKLMTPNTNYDRSNLQPHTAVKRTAATAKIGTGSNISFIRNIIIIIALLATISIVWEKTQNMRETRAAEQAKVDAQKKADLLKREQEAADKINNKKQLNNQTQKTQPNTPSIPNTPKDESPLEALSRLQKKLAQGDRTELPTTAVVRNGRARMYVEQKMTWHQAQRFCEAHGGHIAMPKETIELQQLCNKIKDQKPVWLGAGSSGKNIWNWIDGTPCTLEIRKTSKAAYIAVDNTTIPTPQPGSTQYSFFIEWLMDGTTPASLENQLTRCAESITSSQPIFPAGTISYDNRHYLIIQKNVDWKTARRMAQKASGTLATPSNPDEKIWLLEFISKSIMQEHACWIGAFRPAMKDWQWANGEPWQFAQWRKGAPNEKPKITAACAAHADKHWDDYAIDTPLSHFIIEWSKDTEAIETNHNSDPPVDGLTPLKLKCATLITNVQKKYKRNFQNNIKAYEQELDGVLRRLTKSKQAQISPIIRAMTSKYPNNRIPKNISRSNMPQKAAEILERNLQQQAVIELKLLEEVEIIRIRYRENLQKMQKQLRQKGLTSNARKIGQELRKTSHDTQKFIDYITTAE